MQLIEAVAGEEWWEDVTVPMLEVARKRLRALVKLIEKAKRKPVYSDFEDELGPEMTVGLPNLQPGTNLERFRAKALQFLSAHENHITIHKVRFNEPLTLSDLDELERMMMEAGVGSAEDFVRAKEQSKGFGLFLRSLVGLDRQAAKEAMAGFLSAGTASANQIEFVSLIVDHLTENGVMDAALLYQSPFTDHSPHGPEGLFSPQQVEQLFSERRLVERSCLPEAARQEQSNSPVMKDTEQVGVTNEELAEVHGDAPVHEVEEHEPARVILLDSDRQLVREAADRLLRSRSERDVWVVLWTRPGLLCQVKEGALIAFGTQPPAASIAEHGIENHRPLDHPANRAKTTVAVVRLANRFVERFVVDVVQAATSDRPWLDGLREASGHQSGHELTAVPAAYCPGKLAVLPLQKTSGMNHDGHDELALPLRQAVLAQSGHAADADAVEARAGRIFVRHRNSSIPRGRGPERPPPPREATT
jgi:hypothetical protein